MRFKMEIKKIHNENTTRIETVDGVSLIRVNAFDDITSIKAAFSTRFGGVSKGCYESMNLSFNRGDSKENVMENFNRISKALGVLVEDMVMTHQTHTNNVLVATSDLKGCGITKPYTYTDVDGFVTNEKNLCLVTSFADCVPIFLVDTKNTAIAALHSGWKGTLNNIIHNGISAMKENYNTAPEDLVAFIGPSICEECYEVSADVADKFRMNYNIEEVFEILRAKGDRKYYLNLHKACEINLRKEGVIKENIHITDMCTACNSDIIFSYRKTYGMRGGMCGFLWIEK